jgi:hypothetical protein
MMRKWFVSALCATLVSGIAGASSVVSAKEVTSPSSTTAVVTPLKAMDKGEVGVKSEQKKLVGTVKSGKGPQAGQLHRSSGDFYIKDIPPGTHALEWIVKEGQVDHFDVKEHVFLLLDPTWWYGVRHGNRTSSISKDEEINHFYIADPVGATGDFVVEVYAVYNQ